MKKCVNCNHIFKPYTNLKKNYIIKKDCRCDKIWLPCTDKNKDYYE